MSETVRVVVDAMGGDNAPGEIVKGAVQAVQAEKDIKVFQVGQPGCIFDPFFIRDTPGTSQ